MKNYDFGRRGEDIASSYLKRKNHRIIDRNFRIRQGEIDLISLDGEYIVFTEVKSRRGSNMGRPSEAVNEEKIDRIRKVAEYYYYSKNHMDKQIRFDIIEVFIRNIDIEINHIENAF